MLLVKSPRPRVTILTDDEYSPHFGVGRQVLTTSVSQSNPPLPSAIMETCLDVANLPRSREFYAGLFGYSVMQSDDRFCAFSAGGRQMLLLFVRGTDPQGTTLPFGTIPPHGTSGPAHVGFSIPSESLASVAGTPC